MNQQDKKYLNMTIPLAKKGIGKVSPNPLVGAIIVSGGKIISTGYHKCCGANHAEVEAIEKAKQNLRGATLYVNLEPCAHYGRTPPCVDRIIKSGITRVVIGLKDPNPYTNGKGIKKLKKAGIKVEVSQEIEKFEDLNEIFIKYITKKTPFVCLKAGQSLDGKIATKRGESKWITSEFSRKKAQNLRKKYDCILVGINTILRDNPYLSYRNNKKTAKDFPIKIVLDAYLKISLKANIFSKKSPAPAIIATTKLASKTKLKKLNNLGVDVVVCPVVNKDKVDIKYLMNYLYQNEISSVLVEGGSQVNGSFFDAKLVDRAYFFIASKIIGGKDAVSSVSGKGVDKLKKGIKIVNAKIAKLGTDILFEGKVSY